MKQDEFEARVRKAFHIWELSVLNKSIDEAVAEYRERLLSTDAQERADSAADSFLKCFEEAGQ